MFPFSKDCHPEDTPRPSFGVGTGVGRSREHASFSPLVPPAGGRYPEAVAAPAKPHSEGGKPREGWGHPKSGRVEGSSHPGCGMQGRAAQTSALLTPQILLSAPPSPFPSQLPKLGSLHLTDPNSLASLDVPANLLSPPWFTPKSSSPFFLTPPPPPAQVLLFLKLPPGVPPFALSNSLFAFKIVP